MQKKLTIDYVLKSIYWSNSKYLGLFPLAENNISEVDEEEAIALNYSLINLEMIIRQRK